MTGPAYTAPATLEDALAAKHEYGGNARVIAGGTDLVLRMRDRVFEPELLIDLRRLSLDGIQLEGDVLRLGAYAPLERVMNNPDVLGHFPALPEACRHFAGPPIRNLATLGGNIVNASPAADTVPPMMAYGAEVVLASGAGERTLLLDSYFTGPGTSILAEDEVLTEIRLPLPAGRAASIFVKLGQRRSMAISVVNVAACLTLGVEGKVSSARVVLGSVAATPLRAKSAEAALEGNSLSTELIRAAAEQARGEATPISDVRGSETYRDQMVEVLVRRALTTVSKALAQ